MDLASEFANEKLLIGGLSGGIITFFELNRHDTVPISIDRKR